MCRSHFITGFPSIRVFRRAHDDIYIHGQHEHESYTGGGEGWLGGWRCMGLGQGGEGHEGDTRSHHTMALLGQWWRCLDLGQGGRGMRATHAATTQRRLLGNWWRIATYIMASSRLLIPIDWFISPTSTA
jgi:hypothetical protein